MKSSQILFLICSIFLFGCNNVIDKRSDFVKRYNSEANKINTSFLVRSKAEVLENNAVKIDLLFKSAGDTAKQAMIKHSLPLWTRDVLLKDLDFKYMIDHGVKFNVNLFTEYEIPIDKIVIDKKYIDSLPLNTEGADIEQSKLKHTLYVLNKTLPLKTEKEGVLLVKASLLPNHTLEYRYEVADNVVGFFKIKGIESLIEKEMIDKKSVRNIIINDEKREINKIRTVFTDKNGQQVAAIDLAIDAFKVERNFANIDGSKFFKTEFITAFQSELPIKIEKSGIQLNKVSLNKDGVIRFIYLVPSSVSEVFQLLKQKNSTKLGIKPKATMKLLESKGLNINQVEIFYLDENEGVLERVILSKAGYIQLFAQEK